MTRKHYKAIADIINKSDCGFRCLFIKTVSCGLADYFAEDNPSFDREKFLKACGMEN